MEVGGDEEEGRRCRIMLSKEKGREWDGVEREHWKAFSVPHYGEGMGGECDAGDNRKRSGEGRSEMVLGVVGKMLNDLRSGVGA